jgi:hypothetical protein
MLFIAATMSVLAAQRFGEEFGVWDRVGICPIPTLASYDLRGFRFLGESWKPTLASKESIA